MVRVYDIGGGDDPEHVHDRVLTVPNVLSLLRLLFLPFVYADVVDGRYGRAVVLLTVFSLTDWFDGYVARRFDQVSRLGKIFDPISDRLLVIVVGIAMVRAELLPLWALLVLLVRDVVVLVGGALFVGRGEAPPAVTRTGKSATFGLMFTLPTFVLAAVLAGPDELQDPTTLAVAWVMYATATVLYYVAAGQYAREVLRRRREAAPPATAGRDGARAAD